MLAEYAAEKTIVCLGDSITFGKGAVNPVRDAWPAVLERLLGANWKVINLGVSGKTLMDEAHAPYRATGKVEEAKQYSYKTAFIMIGTNDAFDPAWDEILYQAELEALVDEIAEAATESARIILMAPPAVFFGLDRYERDHVPLDRMGSTLRSIIKHVADRKNAQFVDLYAFTEQHPEWFPDQLHPNEEGNAEIGRYLFEKLFA